MPYVHVRWKKKRCKKGRARDRTGIAGIRIQSDNHYTTQPYLLKEGTFFGYISNKKMDMVFHAILVQVIGTCH